MKVYFPDPGFPTKQNIPSPSPSSQGLNVSLTFSQSQFRPLSFNSASLNAQSNVPPSASVSISLRDLLHAIISKTLDDGLQDLVVAGQALMADISKDNIAAVVGDVVVR